MADDPREFHRRAIDASRDVVGRVQAADLARPTPCVGWSLIDLLAHMTAQHHGFAAAAGGHGDDPAAWSLPAAGVDPVQAYVSACDVVVEAFARPGVLEARFALPEISETLTFSGRRAIGFHLVDYVAHGWDVARTIDVPFRVDEQVERAALDVALAVPDDDTRLAPRAAFAPSRPVPDGASTMDRILALLGRDPA